MMAAHGFKLKHLDLSNNFISDEVGLLFADGLTVNKTLLSISLADNTLTDQSGLAMLESVKRHPMLSKMDLSKNLIPIKHIIEINK
jgi:Ran GTPase-activating protein (RanGAP) involved in mRNA processing and transport